MLERPIKKSDATLQREDAETRFSRLFQRTVRLVGPRYASMIAELIGAHNEVIKAAVLEEYEKRDG